MFGPEFAGGWIAHSEPLTPAGHAVALPAGAAAGALPPGLFGTTKGTHCPVKASPSSPFEHVWPKYMVWLAGAMRTAATSGAAAAAASPPAMVSLRVNRSVARMVLPAFSGFVNSSLITTLPRINTTISITGQVLGVSGISAALTALSAS